MIHALQLAVIVVTAPLLQGIVKTVRARLQGRRGPSPLQPYRDLRKLLAKQPVLPANGSWIVVAAPGIVAGVALTVAWLVPPYDGASALQIDAIGIALSLALGRFVLVLAALDTRSSFEAMAASREMLFASLSEAPLILALVLGALGAAGTLAGALGAIALSIVMLFETARLPVDSQETHYELTMMHEGQVLEYSGWPLALLQYAGYVRQLALLALAAVLLPGDAATRTLWIVVFLALGAVLERNVAKARLFEVPQLFAIATMLALSGVALRVVGAGWW
ncbi:MAG TPA: NADH-quinone oxidoreductase subunit H [Candidatus Baltobacteraceae bacterium]|nr:NADH-quinone oxidoreductase subunit H [Candidatus Baltobacteraceae bacterium]